MNILQKRGLVPGNILKRYKRFLADVVLVDGSVVTAHCTNTGTMKTCWELGDPVLLESADRPGRKLPYTWLACQRGQHWVGVDTSIPNRVVASALRQGVLPGLGKLLEVRTEVGYGQEGSRIDVLGRNAADRLVYVEVKNTTLKMNEFALFPDAVSERGQKHLRELQRMVEEGHRAALVFIVQRDDVSAFDAARDVDPAYAAALDHAASAGVDVFPVGMKLSAEEQPDGWMLQWTFLGLLPWRKCL